MPTLPLMPTSSDQVSTPMSGGMPNMAPPPGVGGGDLASLLGVGSAPSDPSMMGNPMSDPLQGALSQFDRLAQTISDLARMFPGSEQSASEMMEVLDRWRQQILITMTPQASAMPGADFMM